MTTRRRSITPELAHLLSSDSESASDTSLVLEDLVRIGEASRLRRRGALRLDTAATSTAVGNAGDVAPADSLLANLVAAAHGAVSGGAGGYRVFCGARDWAHDRALRPSPLPGFGFGADDEEDEPAPALEQPWTGCRALVHSAAAPSARDGTWFAHGPATGTVVRLSAAFFARGGRKLRRPCGCASDGVGCRVCGNALGIVYRPCARHLRLFPNPDGARPFYSFFAGATDADPPFAFPPPTVAPPPLNSPVDEFEPDDALESPKF